MKADNAAASFRYFVLRYICCQFTYRTANVKNNATTKSTPISRFLNFWLSGCNWYNVFSIIDTVYIEDSAKKVPAYFLGVSLIHPCHFF